jgi:hypothetical protein
MNLQEFSSSLITKPSEGKTLMNIIMGMGPSGDNVLEALLALYESFPDKVKSDYKAFAGTFATIFGRYEIQEKHLSYYEKFSKVWGPSELAVINKNYSELLKNYSKQSFKNSLEFAKALSSGSMRYQPKEAFDFIEGNFDVLAPILKKGTAKFIENLGKYHCWEGLVQNDYARFKTLCSNLKIDHITVLKQEYVTSYYGFKYLMEKTDDANLLSIIKEIKDIPNFFDGSGFFVPKEKRKDGISNHANVFEITLKLLSDGKHNSFHHLFTTYADEIQNCMQNYFDSKRQVDIYNHQHWDEILNLMVDRSKSHYNREIFQEYEMKRIRDNIQGNFKVIDAIILNNELSVKDDVRTKKMKI